MPSAAASSRITACSAAACWCERRSSVTSRMTPTNPVGSPSQPLIARTWTSAQRTAPATVRKRCAWRSAARSPLSSGAKARACSERSSGWTNSHAGRPRLSSTGEAGGVGPGLAQVRPAAALVGLEDAVAHALEHAAVALLAAAQAALGLAERGQVGVDDHGAEAAPVGGDDRPAALEQRAPALRPSRRGPRRRAPARRAARAAAAPRAGRTACRRDGAGRSARTTRADAGRRRSRSRRTTAAGRRRRRRGRARRAGRAPRTGTRAAPGASAAARARRRCRGTSATACVICPSSPNGSTSIRNMASERRLAHSSELPWPSSAVWMCGSNSCARTAGIASSTVRPTSSPACQPVRSSARPSKSVIRVS